MKFVSVFIFLLSLALGTAAQSFSISGKVVDDASMQAIPYATVGLKETEQYSETDQNGIFHLEDVKPGAYTLTATYIGHKEIRKEITVSNGNLTIDFQLPANAVEMNSVIIQAERKKTLGITRLKDVEGTAIYAGKKSEVVVMDDITANTATNNSRQVYSKIAGLNIWENDGAGIQLGIGGRGLNPNRVSNFNTRQNGYDISADALGYPESYYSPPAEAIDRIEIVRGAASLQYGTQFGGLVNFKLKSGVEDKKIQLLSRQTIGSWNFFNSFNSIGGRVKNVNYYVFYQHKSGDGWRPNSEFDVNTAYASVIYKVNSRLSISGQYTFMHYLAHQPGGLTDKMFEDDPQQSVRDRNWFRVNWNLGALMADYKINDKLKINTRFFGLVAGRSALGILSYINRPDPGTDRQLWFDDYKNWGNETRLLYDYNMGKKSSTLLVGGRYYDGHTNRRQGYGNSGSTGDASDFLFNDDDELAYSGYTFPEHNISLFAENIIRINNKLNIIPGIRYEVIETNANGYYHEVNTDQAGNVIFNQLVNEDLTNKRSLVLGGLGISYRQSDRLQFYANISQNYRAINFSDIRSANPNLTVDPNLRDETGYSADIGLRGNKSDLLNYDVSLFVLHYDNRIGKILPHVSDTIVNNYRTNISESRNIGIESFAELDIWKLIRKEKAKMKLSVFANTTYIHARYINSKEPAVKDKEVELVPSVIFKSGISFRKSKFAASFQYSYTSEQFSDATNALSSPNAIDGIVPEYYVMDFSAEYAISKIFGIYATVNNLSNNMYFTRRADGYPGPGIIPSDGRSFFLTLQVKI